MDKKDKLCFYIMFLVLLFFNINIDSVFAADGTLSNTQKEKIIEHIKNHDPADMSEVRSSDDLTGVVGNSVNWMVYWSDYDSQFYLLYFPPISYACTYANSVSGVKLQFSPFVEPYSCYYFLYGFKSGELSCISSGGHCHPEYGENQLHCIVYRLASFDDIVACSIPLYDNDGLELFDTEKNLEGLEPPDSGGDSGGGGSGGDAGDTGDDSSGILGFLKGILNDIRSDLQALGSGITSLVSGVGGIIQNALKAVFVPSDGFLDEKLDSLKLTVGVKFGLSSMSEIDSWMQTMDAYKPDVKFHIGKHYLNFLSLDVWDSEKSFYFGRLKDFMRVFLYPILLFGNWKYMVWIIRGSRGAGEE